MVTGTRDDCFFSQRRYHTRSRYATYRVTANRWNSIAVERPRRGRQAAGTCACSISNPRCHSTARYQVKKYSRMIAGVHVDIWNFLTLHQISKWIAINRRTIHQILMDMVVKFEEKLSLICHQISSILVIKGSRKQLFSSLIL